MKYLVLSTAVTDVIHFPDGRCVKRAGGGAGWYALSGMLLWSPEVLLLSGIGDDFHLEHGDWFLQNGVSMEGLRRKHNRTPKTIIRYDSSGGRTEHPEFGSDHYRLHEISSEDIEPFCKDCEGLYVFRNLNDMEFWSDVRKLKEKYGFVLMWEIAADAALPKYRDRVLDILGFVDVFSINQSEANSLFDTASDSLEEKLASLHLNLVYYRRGEEGATVIQAGQSIHVPCVDIAKRIDPTGAGNSSSGAVLVGFCENFSLEEIGFMGSIAAGYSIVQFGPAPRIDTKTRAAARLLLNRYSSELKRK